MRLINFPKNPDFSINSHCSPRHSARSKLESQNLIVIPREAKWNRRIYWRTDDGFCNSGQKSPQCRMTRWMALSEFKALRFCQVHQLPKIFRFSYERSLLTPSFCAKRSGVAESKNENGRGERRTLEGKISPDEETLTPLKNPSSSKNQIDPGKILILDFGVVGRG